MVISGLKMNCVIHAHVGQVHVGKTLYFLLTGFWKTIQMAMSSFYGTLLSWHTSRDLIGEVGTLMRTSLKMQ